MWKYTNITTIKVNNWSLDDKQISTNHYKIVYLTAGYDLFV